MGERGVLGSTLGTAKPSIEWKKETVRKTHKKWCVVDKKFLLSVNVGGNGPFEKK